MFFISHSPLLMMAITSLVLGDRIKDSIYTEIESIRPCFRRLNGTHEIGCTSQVGGQVGVVQYLHTEQDINTRLEGADDQFAPFVVLLNPAILSGEVLERLRSSGRVVGVVLPGVEQGRWAGQVPDKGFSADSACPNQESGMYSNSSEEGCRADKPWNEVASGSMWVDWGFPIFLVQDTESTERLHSCWEEYNNKSPLTWPACALELKSNMYAAKDSQTCIRRSNLFNLTPVTVCDPLSDDSIHYFVSPRNSTTTANKTVEQADQSVVVVAARLDALAMFDQAEVGFDSPSTGIVTLLATAKMVAEAMRSRPYKTGIENIMFLLIHGESFDYIGSSRLSYDMENDAFPFDLKKAREDKNFYFNGTQPTLGFQHIKAWVELGQLSNKDGDMVFMHNKEQAEDLLNTLRENAGSLTTLAVPGLPPASVQSLLKQGARFPNVVLTNFEHQFTNAMYHSVYDSATYQGYNYSLGSIQPQTQHLASVAEMVARTVVTLATGGQAPSMTSPAELLNELLHCYTVTANCSMFREASDPLSWPWTKPPEKREKTPWPQYVGVRRSSHTSITKLVLQYLTGDVVEPTETQGTVSDDKKETDISKERTNCLSRNIGQNVFTYVFLVGEGCSNITEVQCGRCYKTTVGTTVASSPAFLEEDYDWTSGQYPTWTESIWKVISGRLFLRASPTQDYGTLGLGLVILLVSLPSVWWMEKHASIIFGNQKGGSEVTAPVNM